VFHRALLLTTMALAALALAVTPAFAGEEPDPTAPPAAQPTPTPTTPTTPTPTVPIVHGSAKLSTSQGCLTKDRAKATVSGKAIASVAFYVDGKKVKTVSSPDSSGRYTLTMSCAHLGFGTHRARAAVSFESGATPTSKTLLFQITRSTATSPQFAG
jgi:hypothetical protein